MCLCVCMWWEHLISNFLAAFSYIIEIDVNTVTKMKIRSPELKHLITGNLYLLTNLSPISPFPSPWQPPLYLFLFWPSLDFTYKWDLYSICVFLISFHIMLLRSFHVVRRGRISFFSVDKQYSIVCVCVCITFSVFIYPSIETLVVSMSWLLWIT